MLSRVPDCEEALHWCRECAGSLWFTATYPKYFTSSYPSHFHIRFLWSLTGNFNFWYGQFHCRELVVSRAVLYLVLWKRVITNQMTEMNPFYEHSRTFFAPFAHLILWIVSPRPQSLKGMTSQVSSSLMLKHWCGNVLDSRSQIGCTYEYRVG